MTKWALVIDKVFASLFGDSDLNSLINTLYTIQTNYNTSFSYPSSSICLLSLGLFFDLALHINICNLWPPLVQLMRRGDVRTLGRYESINFSQQILLFLFFIFIIIVIFFFFFFLLFMMRHH